MKLKEVLIESGDAVESAVSSAASMYIKLENGSAVTLSQMDGSLIQSIRNSLLRGALGIYSVDWGVGEQNKLLSTYQDKIAFLMRYWKYLIAYDLKEMATVESASKRGFLADKFGSPPLADQPHLDEIIKKYEWAVWKEPDLVLDGPKGFGERIIKSGFIRHFYETLAAYSETDPDNFLTRMQWDQPMYYIKHLKDDVRYDQHGRQRPPRWKAGQGFYRSREGDVVHYRGRDDVEITRIPTTLQVLEKAIRDNSDAIAEQYRGVAVEEGKKILNLWDQYSWWDLERGFSEHERDAMGHCGNISGKNRYPAETILSLRQDTGKIKNGKRLLKPVATFILHNEKCWDPDVEAPWLGEMKGKRNKKIEPWIMPMVVKLLETSRIKSCVGDLRYLRDENFCLYLTAGATSARNEWTDLEIADATHLHEVRPDIWYYQGECQFCKHARAEEFQKAQWEDGEAHCLGTKK